MLAHQLRHLGMDARVERWSSVERRARRTSTSSSFGPGPGDPRDDSEPRIAPPARADDRAARRRSGRCSPSASATRCCRCSPGCRSSRCPRRARACGSTVDVFGEDAAIGFYNTFSARRWRGDAHAAARSRDLGATRRPEIVTRCAARVRVGAGPPRVGAVARRAPHARFARGPRARGCRVRAIGCCRRLLNVMHRLDGR